VIHRKVGHFGTGAAPDAHSTVARGHHRREFGMGIAFTAGTYIHWGVVSISLTNFLIIVGMIVVFVLALVLPFPGAHERAGHESDEGDS
jgi:high-affinity Fe2+/Pb2+ permease